MKEKIANYLEEDEVLELLEDSEDDDSWSEEEEAIESSDDNGEIDHLSEEDLSPSDISDINELAVQFLIHSDYFLETICCKMCVTGKMLKDYLYTKTSGLL